MSKIHCVFLKGGCCELASDLACVSTQTMPTTVEACQHCQTVKPAMGVNEVTVSIALSNLRRSGRLDRKLHDHLLKLSKEKCVVTVLSPDEAEQCGVGSIIARKLSWFIRKDESCPICRYRAAKMNQWGADGCEENMDLILSWLEKSASKKGIPFVREIVRAMVVSAINEERRGRCCKKR